MTTPLGLSSSPSWYFPLPFSPALRAFSSFSTVAPLIPPPRFLFEYLGRCPLCFRSPPFLELLPCTNNNSSAGQFFGRPPPPRSPFLGFFLTRITDVTSSPFQGLNFIRSSPPHCPYRIMSVQPFLRRFWTVSRASVQVHLHLPSPSVTILSAVLCLVPPLLGIRFFFLCYAPTPMLPAALFLIVYTIFYPLFFSLLLTSIHSHLSRGCDRIALLSSCDIRDTPLCKR